MPNQIRTFQGTIPALDPRLLPDGAAQVARNVRLDRGTLRPIRQPATAHTLGSAAQTIHRHGGSWLGYDAIVDTAPGPIADDRLYITGDGAPKLLENGSVRDLALSAPTAVPSVTPNNDGSGGEVESTVFAFTYVTDLDEESQPSPVSGAFDLESDETVTIGGFPTNPLPGRGVTKFRIYKSVTSLTGTTGLFYIDEHAVGAGSYTYNPAAQEINEPIPSSDYDPPPDTMKGIISMPNGMMAAYDGREVLFCEPFIPHAWPIKYRLKVDYEIMGLAAFGTYLAIITKGTPYRAEGVHPELMQMEKIEQNVPCLATRSIVDLGYAAAYASPEGVVTITAQGAQNVTGGLLTIDQWEDMAPATFVAEQWEGLYVVSHQPVGAGSRKLSFFNLGSEVPTLTESDLAANDLRRDITTGELFALVGTTDIQQFHPDATSDAAYVWRSKLWDWPFPVNFAACKIEGTAGSAFTARVYADGALKHTSTTLNKPFRLPGDFLAEEWEIEIEGDATITRVSLGETMQSLAA